MSEYQLTAKLLRMSHSQTWDMAKLEWVLKDIEQVDDFETCLCGHFPIKEVCTIANNVTGSETRIGNCCVKKFNNQSDKIFQAVKRIKKDSTRSVNAETLSFALSKRIVSQRDYGFYMDILRKRDLSPKQKSWKQGINIKLQKLL